MRLVRVLAASVAVSLILSVTGVRAQSPLVPRPYRGLFGGDQQDQTRKESLDVSVSGYGGFDSNVAQAQTALFNPGAPIGPAQNAPTTGSDVYGGSATLSYARRWERASFNTFGSVLSENYPSVEKSSGLATGWQTGYSAGVGFNAPVTRRIDIVASTTFVRRPFYELGQVFPALPTVGEVGVPVSVPTLEYGVIPASALRSESQVRISRAFSSRTRFDVFASRGVTRFDEGIYNTFDTSDTRLGGAFDHDLTRNTTLRLAYDYRIGQLGTRGDQRYHSNEINAGVDYHRAYNLWHRASFRFSTGSTILGNQPLQLVQTPPPVSASLKTDSLLVSDQTNSLDIRFILTGTASLVWEFFRSWSARAEITRGINYLDGFAAPAVTNAATAGVAGMVSRRVQVRAGTSYASGGIGTSAQNNNGFDTWQASASADYAMSRHTAAYAEYFFYIYDFQHGVVLPPGLSSHFERHGARVGVKAWVPLCRCQ